MWAVHAQSNIRQAAETAGYAAKFIKATSDIYTAGGPFVKYIQAARKRQADAWKAKAAKKKTNLRGGTSYRANTRKRRGGNLRGTVTTTAKGKSVTMGRSNKRRRTMRAKPYKRRAKKRAKRRKVTYKLSKRIIPLSQKMKFQQWAQITVDTNSSGWGTIRFAANTMERPTGDLNNTGSISSFELPSREVGSAARQPNGYDRWIGSASPGKYANYTVDSYTCDIQHTPCVAADDGGNFIGAILNYTGETGYQSTFDGLDISSIQDMAHPELRMIFKQRKIFNVGKYGQTWRMAWSKGQQYKLHPATKPDDPDDVTLDAVGDNLGDATFRPFHVYFAIGSLGAQAQKTLEFTVLITYNVTLSHPEQFDASADADGTGHYLN